MTRRVISPAQEQCAALMARTQAILAPLRPMAKAEAESYAAQWGETISEGGRAAYNLGSPGEDLAALLAYVDSDCTESALAGSCCGNRSPCLEDLAELERLAAYLRARLESE